MLSEPGGMSNRVSSEMIDVTELSDETKYAVCYPSVSQYEQWADQAEQMGYNSVSRFMTEMIEAGVTQLSGSITYDQETSELREQRNELKRELDASRERIAHLEERVYRGEHRTIIEFLRKQETGASFAEIVQYVIDDTPARIAEILDQMDTDQVESTDGLYQLREDDSDDIK